MLKRKNDNIKDWEENFLFQKIEDVFVCLVCKTKIYSERKYNLQRHYDKNHKSDYENCDKKMRLEKIAELKSEISLTSNKTNEPSFSKNKSSYTENVSISSTGEVHKKLKREQILASYKVALEIAKQKQSFSQRVFVKTCAIKMANALQEIEAAKKI